MKNGRLLRGVLIDGLLGGCGLGGGSVDSSSWSVPAGAEVEQPLDLVYENPTPTEEEIDARVAAEFRGEDVPPLTGDLVRPREVALRQVESADFVLYRTAIPGVYLYDIWFDSDVGGQVWFEASEFETGTLLSAGRTLGNGRLSERSRLVVEGCLSESPCYVEGGEIKIYEGDWDQTYAAEFRLIFRSEGEDGDRVLATKTYEVNGWER